MIPGGPALDIERGKEIRWNPHENVLISLCFTALNKLEKVALKVARKKGKPLVLIVNNVHYLKNDDDGRNVLLQLQQKAESWAASGEHFAECRLPYLTLSRNLDSCV